MARRRSTVAKLPPELREEIGRLREGGKTIDEILQHLREMSAEAEVSRSALGRHVQWLDQEAEDLRRSRRIAEYLHGAVDDGKDALTARVNIEYLHNEMYELLRIMRQSAREAEAEGQKPDVAGRAKAVMAIGRTLANVTRAARTNLDYITAAEKRAAERATKEAAGRAAEAAKAKGMSSETAEFIKAFVLGVKAA